MHASIQSFFDPATGTLTYVAYDPTTRDAVVIDPVLDYDALRVAVSTEHARAVATFVAQHELAVHLVLETHVHADHLSAAPWLKEHFDARVVIGEHVTTVQAIFRDIFHLGRDLAIDGSQFDHLVTDGEVLKAGALQIEVLHTPGHTPACVTYRIGDAAFVGDALFMPDQGTGRCDFPGGSADALYTSIHDRLYQLPGDTRVFVAHDYQPDGRPLRFQTSIGESRERNVHLRASTPRDEFVRFRVERDAGLTPPTLLFPSVQVNIRAGALPPPEANDRRYFKVPIGLYG